VALEAGLFVPFGLIDHARPRCHSCGGSEGSVGIVAVRTLDYALIDAMLEGHRELRPDSTVAAIAEIRLPLGQQKFRRGRLVNRVAIGTDHILLHVNAAADVGTREGLTVAAEARVQGLGWTEFRKGNDGRFAAPGLYMCLAWSVTRLASRIFGSLLTGGKTFVVGIPVKRRPDIRVAGLAYVTADVLRREGKRRKHTQG